MSPANPGTNTPNAIHSDEVKPETWVVVGGRPQPLPGAPLNTPVIAA